MTGRYDNRGAPKVPVPENDMQIAFLLAVHKDPEQVARLLKAIHRSSDIYLIHADRKAPAAFHRRIARIAASYRNVHLLESMKVNWGGWSQCRMMLAAIDRLTSRFPDWRYFVNLSGQDFPIQPIDRFREHLAATPGISHIDVRPIDRLPPRLRTVVRRRQHWFCLEFGGAAWRLPIPIAPFIGRHIGYYGSNWLVFDRRVCEWIVASDVTRRFAAYLRYTHCPDESFFQNLIMNSPFRDRLSRDNGRFYIFDGKPHPVTLTKAHLQRLAGSGAFFARKFDLGVDAEIVATIERRLIAPTPAAGDRRTVERPLSPAVNGREATW